jgi:lipopolysaccharide export system permease protein
MMLRLHRYLFGEVVRPLVAALLFLFQLLFAMQLLRGSEVLFGSAVQASDILHIALLLTPHFLAMALPIAFLVAVLIGLGRLAEDRELLAMSAAGIAPWVLLPVPLLIALVLSTIGLLLGFGPEPHGLAGVRDYSAEMLKRNLQGDVKSGVFFEDLSGLTLYAEHVEANSFRWHHVLVHDDRDPKSPLLVLSEEGQLDAAGKSSMVLHLADGQLHRSAARTDEYSLMHFEQGQLEVGLGEGFFNRNSFRSAKEELTPDELLRGWREATRSEKAEQAREFLVAYQRRWSMPFAPLAFALVAVPLGASLRRAARAAGFGLTGLSFALYYVVGRLGQQWGELGRIGPVLGAQLPNLTFMLLGLFLWWLNRRRA